MVPKPAVIANRPVSFDAKSQFTMASFSSVRDGQKLQKIVYGESVLINNFENQNESLDFWAGRNKLNLKKKKN